MRKHKKVVCNFCGDVVMQCRCISHEVEVEYVKCERCLKAGKMIPTEVRIEDEPRLVEALSKEQNVKDAQSLSRIMEGEDDGRSENAS